MSYALTKAAFQVNAGSASNKLVLLALAWMAGEDRRCAVSCSVIAHWTGLTGRTASKALGELEAQGLVTSRPRGRGRLFHILIDLLPEYPDCDGHGQVACTYCGGTGRAMEMDHVIPRSNGGSNEHSNLTVACVGCNTEKGAMTPEEWLA